MRDTADVLTKLLTNLDYATSSSSAQTISNMLQNHLTLFQQHCMLSSFSQQFFSHVFRFIDATIFNEIISKKELCKFAVAMQIKTSVDELIARVKRAGGEMWFGPVNKLFKHTQQMINCLTLDKNMLSVENVRREVCPDLNLNQITQICTLYVPGEFEDPIPEEVIESIQDDPEYDSLDPSLLDRETFDLDTRDIHFVDVVDIAGKEFTPDMVLEVLDNLDPKRKAAKAKEAAAQKQSGGGGLFGIRFGSLFGSSKPNS
jgi:myosin heavy subunit